MAFYEQAALVHAQSWVDWANQNAMQPRFELPKDAHFQSGAILGLLIQASAENPSEFARAFEPLFGPKAPNPLTATGHGALDSLLRNGVGDDWEIYLQWRESGYAVVPESQRQPQDARFRESQALRLLYLLTGGSRPAPGLADEAALIQDLHQSERPEAPAPKARQPR